MTQPSERNMQEARKLAVAVMQDRCGSKDYTLVDFENMFAAAFQARDDEAEELRKQIRLLCETAHKYQTRCEQSADDIVAGKWTKPSPAEYETQAAKLMDIINAIVSGHKVHGYVHKMYIEKAEEAITAWEQHK